MKRWTALLLLLAMAVPALAYAYEPGGVDDVERTAQASMVVTGLIAVNPDGSVYGYSLDHRNELPPAVVDLIGRTLPQWQFKPVEVDGKPAQARARMSLRVVAHQTKLNQWVASIQGAQFGENAELATGTCPPDECLAYAQIGKPQYPLWAAQNMAGGTVYLVVDVGRDGHVENAAVRQVDLRKLASSNLLDNWRQELATATLRAAKQWTFHVPTTGNLATKSHWLVNIPVVFSIRTAAGNVVGGSSGYGKWTEYLPGPVHPIPWARPSNGSVLAGDNADAIPNDGKPFVLDARFVLLNRLGPSSGAPHPAPATGQG